MLPSSLARPSPPSAICCERRGTASAAWRGRWQPPSALLIWPANGMLAPALCWPMRWHAEGGDASARWSGPGSRALENRKRESMFTPILWCHSSVASVRTKEEPFIGCPFPVFHAMPCLVRYGLHRNKLDLLKYCISSHHV